MKKLLLGLVVLIAVAAVALSYLLQHHAKQETVQVIGVKVVEENGESGGTTYLPLTVGYKSTTDSTSGGDGGYEINESYEVASSYSGQYTVVAHYKITRNGISTEVDKTLPVQTDYQPSPIAQEKLKEATWTKLDDHLRAFAYMSNPAQPQLTSQP